MVARLFARLRSLAAYDSERDPRHWRNRLIAYLHGWSFDPDLETYRNRDNFAMDPDGEFPANAVDCLR